MKVFQVAGFTALVSMSAPVLSADKWAIQPVQVGQETIRYDKGTPTLDLEMDDGVVQITPLPLDHGSLSFGIVVYNDSRQPANFGIENVGVTFDASPVQVFSKDDLVKKAENRAMWASIALAAVGGLSAAAAASQRDHYRSTLITPRGTYHAFYSAPSVAGQIQATAIAAGTGVGIASIQNRLDQTRAMLGDEVIQLTTIDPGESYGGRAVIAKVKPKTLPARVELAIKWNGETYPFAFQIAKNGTPAPTFAAITRSSHLTDFSQGAAPASEPPEAVPASPVSLDGAPAKPVDAPVAVAAVTPLSQQTGPTVAAAASATAANGPTAPVSSAPTAAGGH